MNRNLAVALLLFGLTLHYALAVPVITSFSPEYQAATDPNSVQILGSGFTGGTLIVKFNGVQATTAQATGPNTIVAKVPANAPLGPGPIYVKVGNDETYSSSNFVVISSGPYIHGFSPAGGNAGTQVTITGAHFNTGGSPTIRFGSIIATGGAVSEKEIIINAPAGVTTSLISVTRGTSYTNQTPFYVNPVITGFSPTVGRAGTNVTIRGTNFTGTISVKFGNTTATDFFCNK